MSYISREVIYSQRFANSANAQRVFDGLRIKWEKGLFDEGPNETIEEPKHVVDSGMKAPHRVTLTVLSKRSDADLDQITEERE